MNNNSATLIEVKNHILYLGDSLPRIQDGQVLDNTVRSFCSLLHLSCIFSVTLGNLIMVKMGNNRKKYPVDLCLKSQLTGYTGIPKYTSYSKKTLIGRDCELNLDVPSSSNMTFSQQKERLLHDLPLLSDGVKQFAAERNWLDKYTWHYTSLSLSAEYGELAETVKNSGDSDAVWSMNQCQRSSILSEIADVAIFLLHVVRICDLNVTTNLRCTSD
jgi:NTP pyrophosphatase (non-canonical NTP hydrolase)